MWSSHIPASFFVFSLFLCFFSPAYSASDLPFGVVTSASCPATFEQTLLNYTLTVPSWPTTPAQSFVILIRAPSGIFQYQVTATLGSQTWTILGDTQNYEAGELWIPQQVQGTVVSISLVCGGLTSSYTLQPIIPVGIDNVVAGQNINYQSVSDTGAHWFAVPVSTGIVEDFVWSELCEAPSTSNYLVKTRVVIPGVNVSSSPCKGENNVYSIDGSSNVRLISSVGSKISWVGLQNNVNVVYVSVYAIDLSSNLIAINYNIYHMNSNVDIQIYGSFAGMFEGHAIQIQDNLFISGVEGSYYPTNTNMMTLYYLDLSSTAPKTNLDPSFFVSACYLKNKAQSAVFAGGLKNGTQDNQVLMSNGQLLKAREFFKGKPFATSSIFAVTYGDWIVLPTMSDSTKIALPDNYWMIGVIAGLAALSAISLVAVGVLLVMVKRRGYKALH